MIADIAPESVSAFQHYEDRVLVLLTRHGGRLERRLRTADQLTEVHIVSFGSQVGYEDYLGDPERIASRHLLTGADITQRLHEMRDVSTP